MTGPFNSDAEYKQTLLELLPEQGHWSDDAYLGLTDHARRLVEFTDGHIEFLPWPTDLHQSIVGFFLIAFTAYLKPINGIAHVVGLRLKIRPGKFREPDVLLVKAADDPRRRRRFWTGADLAVEVASEEKSERDLVDKVHDYAEGNIPEYWIVNPFTETITVLRLQDGAYVEHGVFGRGTRATSVILPGFSVKASEVFDIKSPPDDLEDD